MSRRQMWSAVCPPNVEAIWGKEKTKKKFRFLEGPDEMESESPWREKN